MNDLIKYTAESYGFIIPRNKTLLGEEFSNLIKEHYEMNPRNLACAEAAKKIKLICNINGVLKYSFA